MNTTPLICAKCAEERQIFIEYAEINWEKRGDMYIGKPTGKKLPLPKWKVDDNGRVPSYEGPGHEDWPMRMTNHLLIDLRDVSKEYSYGETDMIPAIPAKNGEFWSYESCPEVAYIRWENLPTK